MTSVHVLFALALLILPSQTRAQDVKELMGRAQSQADQRAVDELVRRLQSGAGARPAAAPAAANPPAAAPAAPPPPSPPEPAARVTMPATQPLPPASERPKSTPRPVEPAAKPIIAAPAPPPSPPPAAVLPTQPAAGPFEPMPDQPFPRRPVEAAPAVAPAVVAPPKVTVPAAPVEVAHPAAPPSVDIEVYFNPNSAEITPKAAATLTILGRALTDPRLAGARFLIGGHTDALGDPRANLLLSDRRAEAVRRYLIEQFGIDRTRLVGRGFGDQRLKFPGRPRAIENRRVQVVNLSAQLAR